MGLLQVGLGDHEVALDHVQGLVTEDGLQGKDVGVNAKLPECGPCMGAKAVDNSRISCYANSVGSVKAGLRIFALSLFPPTLSSAASSWPSTIRFACQSGCIAGVVGILQGGLIS